MPAFQIAPLKHQNLIMGEIGFDYGKRFNSFFENIVLGDELKIMRKSLIIIAVIGVMLCMVGAVLFANAFASTNNPNANNVAQQVNVLPSQSVNNPGGPILPGNWTFPGNFTFQGNFGPRGNFGSQGRMMHGMHGQQMFGPQLSGAFLQNATLSSVTGSVVTETRGLLLLDTSSGQVSIQIPNQWNIGSQVVPGYTLFNGTFVSSGQTVTLQVLESNVFSNTSFNLNEMVGYQATNATDTVATAVLSFNIQPAN